MQKHHLAVIVLLCIALVALFPAHAQEISPAERVVLNDTLVIMGIDFSVARMVSEEDKLNASFISHKHGASWCAEGSKICRTTNLGFDFHKKNVICRPGIMDSSYLYLADDWVLSRYQGICTDSVAAHVRSYPLHIERYPLGIVFVVDRMDRASGVLTMYAVYIDLRTHEPVKIIKCAGVGEGFGYGMFWGHAIRDAYEHFVNSHHNYLNDLKRKFKRA